MKRVFIPILPIIITSQLFAIVGFGLQLGESIFSVEENSPINSEFVQLTNGAFNDADTYGGYIYLDMLPVVDLEVDFSGQAKTYEIQFTNNAGTMDPLDFGWASTNLYITVRKKIFGLNIPFLAKAKLFAGGGYNMHATTPLASEEMITDLLGGDIITGDVSDLGDKLKEYLSEEDNYITSSGFHLQGGLQFKLLIVDSFIFYRHVFVEDVIPDTKSFGGLNIRLGIGF